MESKKSYFFFPLLSPHNLGVCFYFILLFVLILCSFFGVLSSILWLFALRGFVFSPPKPTSLFYFSTEPFLFFRETEKKRLFSGRAKTVCLYAVVATLDHIIS